MGLRVIGKVLGVSIEHGNTRSGEAFTRRTIHVLDGVESEAVATGRNFDLNALNSIGEGDHIDLGVSLFNGRVYAERVMGHEKAGK